jgi:hypothetical protein
MHTQDNVVCFSCHTSCAKTAEMPVFRRSKVCSIRLAKTEKSETVYKKTVDGLSENN